MPDYQMAHTTLTEELGETASLHSLGLLDPATAHDWEHHLEICAVCAEETRACSELLAEVSTAEAPFLAQPPARVKDALMRQIATPAPGLAPLILRAAEGIWNKVMPGIEAKRLFVDPVTQSVTSLVRVAAGAIYPAHIHKGLEHLYVLDGEIVFEDHSLATGDYEVRTPETRHSSATTAPGEDCLLLVINSGRDEYLL